MTRPTYPIYEIRDRDGNPVLADRVEINGVTFYEMSIPYPEDDLMTIRAHRLLEGPHGNQS